MRPAQLPFAALLAFLAALTNNPTGVQAQGRISDYDRANNLRRLTDGKVFRHRVDPRWYSPTRFWYRNQLAGKRMEFVHVDAKAGKRTVAFDHARLAAALSKLRNTEFTAQRLPIDWLEYSDDNKRCTIVAFGKGWEFSFDDYDPQEVAKPDTKPLAIPKDSPSDRNDKTARGSRRSPDDKLEVFTRDHNLFLKDRESNEETQLTDDGNEEHHYVANIFWTDDSKRFIAMKRRREETHTIYMVESSPKDQLQPKLHKMQYLKPGDRISQTKPRLFDAVSKKEIPVNDELFENPWSIGDFHWLPDGRRFAFLYNPRGHQGLRVVVIDTETGEVSKLIDEMTQTFVDYAHKKFSYHLPGTNEIIWMSERDGWNHLYLYDSRSAAVKQQITNGDWVVRKIDRVDVEKRQIWFQASGVYSDQDPYYIHHCRVNFDGSGMVILTDGDGTHSIQYSPDREYVIDKFSRVDMPPKHELRRVADGSLVCNLEVGDWDALLATDWVPPERFTAKGRDGKTDIYGVIWHPMNFDKSKKYPVIEHIYAGPHSSFTPKSFRSHYRTQSLAELGFIVVQLDGMGTSNRSKAFHDMCWKNLGDSGFPDRIAWLQAAAKQRPYMDLERVGIYGGSAGGQSSTRAVLAHGDFYKVAVSDCGCHDNRMDKIWWNELWMSWPVGPHYAAQSNVTNAHRLKGNLLLIVGELDRNVDPASTMQVVNALIKADRDFDMLVVPGGGHGIAESRYGTRRRRDYFVRHLLGVEPRSEP